MSTPQSDLEAVLDEFGSFQVMKPEWFPPKTQVVDLSGGKPPDHFANQEDLAKAEEMERRLLNHLQRARSIAHQLKKVYQGAVRTPTRWDKTQVVAQEMYRAVADAEFAARRASGIRSGNRGWG